MAEIPRIGADRQFFVDPFWIERSQGVERRLHEPMRRNTAIAADRPWDRGGVSYMTVFPDGGRLRAWYRCDCEMPIRDDRRLPLIACAESDDGVHWEKPSLGVVEFDGSTDTNLVWRGPGTLSDFGERYGDEIDGVVSWNGRGVGDLAGESVRLRVTLQDADLYAFRFRQRAR